MNIPYIFKKCTKCGEWLVANNYNFHKQKNGKWGLQSRCKKCKNNINKQWKENNKEHIMEYNKEYHKQYYENNKEYHREKNKQWRENNKERKIELEKEWRKNNKEYIKEHSKQHYENNKEYYKEKNKQWREENPEKVFNQNTKRRFKEENQGRGIDKEQYKECNKWFDWKCGYSGEKLKQENSTYGRTLDHIVALDNGGLNEPWNVVPMRKGYNTSKRNNENTLNWYMEQEYFSEERLQRIIEWQIYAYEKWGGEEFGELILITDLFEEEK